jgi:signal transduction histidine kinase
MNILKLYSTIVKNEDVLANDGFRKDFSTIIPKVTSFVSELLDNIAASHVPISFEKPAEVDINRIIDEVIISFEERLKNSKIKVENDPGQLPKITAGPEMIKNAFYEIIKNSIEAIEEYDHKREEGMVPKTGGLISIKTALNETGEVEAIISDNGIGIEEMYIDKVLNPFFTTKIHSVAHSETGTGLGLNKVYNTVQIQGGSLKISSKLGEGTTVQVSFGLRPNDLSEPKS